MLDPNFYLIYKNKTNKFYRGPFRNEALAIYKVSDLNREKEQLNREYQLLQKLKHPNIIQSYGVSTIEQRAALVLEDFEFASLADTLLKKNLPLEVSLQISIEICEALIVIHQKDVVHNNLVPQNILLNETTKDIKLIGFDLASDSFGTNQKILKDSKDIDIDSLPYKSPEQIGMVKHEISPRSDIYTFGATLYHMLTGKRPFEAESPTKLIRDINALERLDDGIAGRDVPATLLKIVSKLMSKSPNKRYQSAFGIKYDLEKCLSEWQQNQKVEEFSIATHDFSDKFIISEKLYGREEELEKLLEIYKRALGSETSTCEAILVKGESGVGKTAFVEQLHHKVLNEKGYFTSGKFEKEDKNIPYSAFTQALNNLIEQFLYGLDEQFTEQRTILKKRLSKALGENVSLITDIIPSLKKLQLEQFEIPTLPAEKAKNRFNLTLQKFLETLAEYGHPLVLFLDDLQWADGTLLQLVDQILISSGKSLLFIGAYREETEGLRKFIKNIEENVPTQKIELHSLQGTHLKELLNDTLNVSQTKISQVDVNQLANIVHRKTHGTPLFVHEFLKSLCEQGLINFIPPNDSQKRGKWSWDEAAIKEKGPSNNVLLVLLERINTLETHPKKLLQLASCIGREFKKSTLLALSQTSSEDDLLESLKLLVRKRLVQQHSDYETFSFIHDRIWQATEKSFEKDKQAYHFEIGKHLLKDKEGEPLENLKEDIFPITNHHNEAVKLQTKPKEQITLLKLNLAAGKYAKELFNYTLAKEYLEKALKTLETLSFNLWESEFELAFQLHEEAAQVFYLLGDFQRGDEFFQVVTDCAKEILQKISVYKARIRALTSKNELKEAIICGLSILKDLGVSLPLRPKRLHIFWHLLKVSSLLLLKHKSAARLVKLPKIQKEKKPKAFAVLEIFATLAFPARMWSDHLFTLIALKQSAWQLNHGNYSVLPYVTYGIALTAMVNKSSKPFIRNIGIKLGYPYAKLATSRGSKWKEDEHFHLAQLLLHVGISPWERSSKEIAKKVFETYKAALDDGDLFAASLALAVHYSFKWNSGENLLEIDKGLQESNKILTYQLKQEAGLGFSLLRMCWQVTNDFLNESHYSLLKGDKYNEESLPARIALENNPTERYTLNLWKVALNHFMGEYDEAFKYVEELNTMVRKGDGNPDLVNPHRIFYGSLPSLIRYSKTKERKLLLQVKKNQSIMKLWSKQMKESFHYRYLLVEAEKYRALGQYDKALSYYRKAAKGGIEKVPMHHLALIQELTGICLLEEGDEYLAKQYLREALVTYDKWGAKVKVEKIRQKYQLFEHEAVAFKPADLISKLDHESLVENLQILAKEINFEPLIESCIEIIVKNAGAKRGILILPEEQQIKTGELNWEIACQYDIGKGLDVKKEILLRDSTKSFPVGVVLKFIHNKDEEIKILTSLTKDQTQSKYLSSLEKPWSVMILPLKHQGKFIGAIYLEHNSQDKIFSQDRQSTLKMLAIQTAISLDNSMLLRKLSDSRQSISSIVEEVCNEVAHDLHGKVPVRLNSIKERFEQCVKEESISNTFQQKIEKICDELESIREDTRKLSHRIYPFIVNLEDSILEMLDTFAFESTLEIDSKIRNLDKIGKCQIKESLRIQVYRILEAALGNVDKHSKASKVKILLQHKTWDDKETLKLCVKDNGCGFNTKLIKPNFGLKSINHNVNLADGSWSIDSTIGKGTIIVAYLPLK